MSRGLLESGPFSGELMVDAEAQRIAEFFDMLGEISIIKTINPDIDFTNERPIDAAQKRFMTYEYDEQQAGPALFLNPAVMARPEGENTYLEFEPLIARSGKRSAHGVFFGILSVSGCDLPVAVKPHTNDNAFQTGLNDYFKLHAFAEEGFDTLQPAGLILSDRETNRGYSLTVLEEGLTTFESIDWVNFYPNVVDNPGMQEMWRKVSDVTAMLHADGNKSHGDLAARNIAQLPEGCTYLIDWEYAYISKEPPVSVEARYRQSYADLKVLLESMCLPSHKVVEGKLGIGIFYGKDGDWWEGFRQVFFDEYVAMRKHLAAEGSHRGKVRDEVKQEIYLLERSLREDIETHRQTCADIPPPEANS